MSEIQISITCMAIYGGGTYLTMLLIYFFDNSNLLAKYDILALAILAWPATLITMATIALFNVLIAIYTFFYCNTPPK